MDQQYPSTSPLPIPPTPATAPRPTTWIMMVIMMIAGISLGIVGTLMYQQYTHSPKISSYEDCVKASGSTIQESYPATCVTREGKRFVQPIEPTGTNPIYTDPMSCNTDADCAVGIQSDACCVCPKAINASEIGKNGWVGYETYTKQKDTKTCETFAACAPCEKPSDPVCRNKVCTFSDTGTPPQSTKKYVCPENEWVDCMPGPDSAGMRFECTQPYLSWAKENCPNFKGAAL